LIYIKSSIYLFASIIIIINQTPITMQGAPTAVIIIYLAIVLLMIVSMWITVSKAGRPGVSQIIPIWNFIELVRISGKPLWWVILILLIPFVNLILMIIVFHGISKAFGKDAGFTVGLVLLPFIFWPILAFGKATYTAPAVPPAP
jgi:hypothetical protein